MNIKELNNQIEQMLEEYNMEPQEVKWANKEMKTKVIAAPRGYSSDNDFVFSNTFDEIDIKTAAQDISGFGPDELNRIEQNKFIDGWYSNYYIKCSEPNLVREIVSTARDINNQNGWS